eukprot:7388583-Prymnesium_polylepis.2
MSLVDLDPQKTQGYNDLYIHKKGWFTDGHTRLNAVIIVATNKKGEDIKVFEAYGHFTKQEEVFQMAYLLTGKTRREVSYTGLICGGTVVEGKLNKGPAANFPSTAFVPHGIKVDGCC